MTVHFRWYNKKRETSVALVLKRWSNRYHCRFIRKSALQKGKHVTWLTIFLGAFLGGAIALVLLLVILWFGFKFWLRSKVAGFAEQFEALAAGMNSVPPFRLRLSPGTDEGWDNDQARPLYAPLLERGFVDAGSFHIDEDPPYAFGLRALVHEQLGISAAVFHHDQAGYWLELVSRFNDGTSLTYSTVPDPMVNVPDYKQQKHFPDLEPQALLDQFLAARTKQPEPVSADRFGQALCDAYAREMDWRIERGGVTEEEIRRQAAKSGTTDPKQIQLSIDNVREQWRVAINEFFDEQLRTNFVQSAKMEPAKWEQVRDRLLFVHDRLFGNELYSRIENLLYAINCDDLCEDESLTDALSEACNGSSAKASLAKVTQLLTKHHVQVKKLGTLKKPIEADVYSLKAPASQPALGSSE